MTEDEKAAVLQFMGQTYGHTHKQDQMIVGESQQLSPQSHVIKQQFEQVLNTPTQPQQQNAPAPVPVQEPVAPLAESATPAEPPGYMPPAPVSVEQAQQELAAAVTNTDQANTNQVEFDFSEPSKIDKLITLVEKQHLLLKEINIKLGNGKATKGNRQK